jgi:DNA-binding response OmpR family regulator
MLVVDDHHDSCAWRSDIIAESGYRGDVAHDRPAALGPSRRHPCGPAVLDDQLPGMDGVALDDPLKHVRAGIRRVLAKPAACGRLTPRIEEVAGAP